MSVYAAKFVADPTLLAGDGRLTALFGVDDLWGMLRYS